MLLNPTSSGFGVDLHNLLKTLVDGVHVGNDASAPIVEYGGIYLGGDGYGGPIVEDQIDSSSIVVQDAVGDVADTLTDVS